MTAALPVQPNKFTPQGEAYTRLREILDGSSILVTGGTGSFGKAFIARLLDLAEPARIVVFSRDELKQYEMQQTAPFSKCSRLRFFIGDVRDQGRLDMALRGVDTVIHAAAMKHVPAAEYNPFECIHTNVLGAENIVQASLRNDVKRVLALSTDKAVNPVNLYGASKLAADKIFVAANNLSGRHRTHFSVVRYGNVLGSRGSVVPFFARLIAEGADSLPITDERMTRFWITINQGVDFVLSSLMDMDGGEVFVPKIPSMRITDLAKAMAPHLPHRVIGIRPGEKLHEAMISEDDARNTLEFADRHVIRPTYFNYPFAEPADQNGIPEGARQVPELFTYSSDTNTEWLGLDEMRALMDQRC
ncbi:MAG: UDP-N-acetylglucosamine 4,6-dehydratase (inverting) [Rhodospirillales bacterium]|nr:UDP-N-acetylglucosamine 4,6-dehydratase (inverting) [Rhodospirillales bacterium]